MLRQKDRGVIWLKRIMRDRVRRDPNGISSQGSAVCRVEDLLDAKDSLDATTLSLIKIQLDNLGLP